MEEYINIDIASNMMNEEIEYWKKVFNNEFIKTQVPYRNNFKYNKEQNSTKHYRFEDEISSKIIKLCNKKDESVYLFLYSILSTLLYKYTDNQIITIESPIYKQKKERALINTRVPLIQTFKSNSTFREILINSSNIVNESYKYGNFPIEKIYEIVDENENSELALTDVMFALENIQEVKYLDDIGEKIKFVFSVKEESIRLNIIYNRNLYDEYCINKLYEHITKLIICVLNDINIKLNEIYILLEDEKEQILRTFNNTKKDYPLNKTLQWVFEDQVNKTPDNIAVVFEDNKLTYKELNEKANRLARTLIKKGVKPDTLVGIMVDPSVEMMIGIMGILKAGAAYLPIEPEYPNDRIEYILKDSKTNVLLTQAKFETKFKYDGEILDLNDEKIDDNDSRNIETKYNSNNLAYVIYTSGTTGYPKGVLIEHRNAINLVFGLNEDIYSKYGQELNVALVASYVFDASVQQIFPSILFGNTLYIVPKDTKKDGNLLLKYYDNNLIDISDGTPVHINMLSNLEDVEKYRLNVKHFIIGGDIFSINLAKNFYNKYKYDDAKFTNIYGPTECCVDSIAYHFDKETLGELKCIPIGKPMNNETVYILDKDLNILPIGIIGELYISGDGVGRGYLNNKELTKEKFIENPFTNSGKMYKTGDYARWNSDGNIEFIGRIDNQVKIRGHRIELGEIENKLLNFGKELEKNNVEEKKEVKRCNKCLLSSEYPNVNINEDGICNYCESYEMYKEEANKYFKEINDFEEIIKKAKKTKTGEYDCLLLYSGGKDSSYVLYRLVEMGLKVLAFTFDNGYISETAFKNIKRVTSELNVDSIISKNENMDEIFLESLKNDCTVCTGCFKALTAISTKIAYENGINLIVTGLSRGQIFDTKLHGLYDQGIFNVEEVEEKLVLFRKIYHSVQDKTAKLLNVNLNEDKFFDESYFVDFFRYEEASPKEVKEYLKKKDKFWSLPGDTGFCSTNCLINDVGIYVHLNNKSYHNYEAPLSWDCRLGQLSREDGLLEINPVVDEKRVHSILNKIGYKNKQENCHKHIKKAVVLDKEDENSNKYLCAYVVSDEELTVSELREYLSTELPEYMIPSYFIQVEEIPTTINGKVDKKALIKNENNIKSGAKYENPRNKTDERLIAIWREVLGMDKISINDNFFDLGGQSIKVIQLISKINKELGSNMPVSIIFSKPTIKQISDMLLKNSSYKFNEVIKLNDNGDNNLFAFPPIHGLGIAFNEFATLISTHTLYTFDYIDAPDRINQYINLITSVQPKGNYSLMGYSAGGNLVFEVAKEIEKRGYGVKDIIIVDSRPRIFNSQLIHFNITEEVDKLSKGNLKYENNDLLEVIKLLDDKTKEKMNSYYKYQTMEADSKGGLKANIHHIISENSDEREIEEKTKWGLLTSGRFELYKGKGTHLYMFNGESLKYNYKIIDSILNSK